MISFIIVNYNSLRDLERCVQSIYDKIRSAPFEIIIVNNSPEENLRGIKNIWKDILIIENTNKGYSAGCNLGAKYSNGEYLIFLNPDTIILNDFFQELFNYFKNKNYGAIGFKIYDENNQFTISFGRFPTLSGEFHNKKIKNAFRKGNQKVINSIESYYQNPTKVDWVTGAALFIKKSTFESITGFDERFFLYYEDADLCKRISKFGLDNYIFPYGKIIHLEAENIRENFSDIYIHAKKSQLLYYKLHNGKFQTFILRFYLSFKFILKYLLSFNKKNFKLFLISIGIKE
ncbi:MAG: glycosyltransferase family 2 protein [Ignavibacteria bacterium]|nr:glycosyltransferase family 2 protein [Ignavibacteria bacterium]